MSAEQSLETLLNNRADREFDRIKYEITAKLRQPTEAFGTSTSRTWKDSQGTERTFFSLKESCDKCLEVFREDFRQKFRSDFIAKVEAMKKEMESYIGALNTEQEVGK